MRLRVVVGGVVARELKIPKDQRTRVSEGIAKLERMQDEWLEPVSLSVADTRVDGLLKSIERMKENDEEIIVFQFWENS